MGYICILVALLAGTTKGYMGKRLGNTVSTHRQSVFVNMIRMVICIFISVGVLAVEAWGAGVRLDSAAWAFGAMAGVTVSVFMVTWLLAVRRGAFMLISVAQMFGVVVTLVCSLIVFRTPISWRQCLAMVILIAAVLIMGSYSTALKGRLGVGAIILLILCGVSSGLYDFSLKLFTHYSASSVATLNLITYVIAALALLLVFALPSGGEKFDAAGMLRSTFVSILIMSVCLFVNSYFKALANNYLTPAQVYPIYQAGGLIASAVMAAVFFRERITPRCVVGLILAFVAIILLK
ncbi:MAG: EamA family transporter [Clostridia bacterium]|nr:EamA family transporter [Clostridia bacterium]